jgi:predicted lipoprotein with Yx(FWY)xxD motif
MRLITLVLGLALVAAACGSDADTGTEVAPAPTEATTEATAAPTEATTEATTAPAAESVEVGLADTSLGSVLVDGSGMTLYAFLNDTAGSSTCYDQCADNWPALLGEAVAGTGLDSALFGTTERTDGTVQVVYGDWPLYYFAGDSAAGDVNGQDVGDVWYVVGADGNVITDAGAQAPAEVPEGAITVADSTLGSIVVDAAGMTLYGFTNDTDGTSTCYEGCAQAWPPLPGDTPIDPNLLDADQFRVIDRDDGTTQLAYGDWPLYYYAGDTTAGDVTGQNVGEVWFVVAPDASLILGG